MRLRIFLLVIATLAIGVGIAVADGASPSFTFSTDEPGATFTCQLDNGTAAACASPKAYTGLVPGQHTETIVGTFTVPQPSPPSTGALVGDQTVEPTADNNGAGNAQAWSYTAMASGTITTAHLYVDTGNAVPITVGLYAAQGSSPGQLLASATIQSPTAGAWNIATINNGPTIASGTKYWLAVLGTSGAPRFRDNKTGSCTTVGSSSGSLTAMPVNWTSGWTASGYCPASFYLDGTAPVLSAPTNTTPPSIGGITSQGSTLTADPGTWTGSPAPTFAYQWQDCTPGCSDIAGATSRTYVLQASDVNDNIAVKVTATNSQGSSTATSAQVGPVTAASSGGGGFAIQGTSIIAPDGSHFIPVGANLNGQDDWWSDTILGKSNLAQEWGWNTVRLNTCYAGGCPASVDGCGSSCDFHQSPYLDQAITEYTGKNIVSIIELQQYTGLDDALCGSQANLDQLKQWWTDLANRYKGNPYVWFNILNEPTSGSDLTCWQTDVQGSVQAIRNAGANNIIVLDGSNWGQELGDWSCTNLPYQNSAIVNNIAGANGLEATYGNILPSVHMYSDWGGGASGCTQAQLEARWHSYLDHVHSLNLPLVVGETGDKPGCTSTSDGFPAQGQCSAAVAAFDCTRQYNVGLLWWHSSGGSGFNLVQNDGWEDFNSPTSPTDLTTFSGYAIPGGGQSLWDYGHGRQFTCSG